MSGKSPSPLRLARGNPATAVLDALWLLAPSAIGVALWLFPLRMRLMEPDSLGYITGHWSRPPAYPGILSGLVRLGFEPQDVVWLQLCALVAASTFLGYAIRRATGSPILALVAVLSIAMNMGLMRWAFTILTEAFAITSTAVFIAAVLLYGCMGRGRWLFFAGAALAFAVSLRYAAVGGLAALAVPVVLGPGSWRRRVLCSAGGAGLVVIAVFLAAPLTSLADKPEKSLSTGLHNLLGVIGLWAEEGISPRQPGFVDELARQLAPYRDARPRMGDWRDRQSLDLWAGEHIRYGIFSKIADRLDGPMDEAVRAAIIDIAKEHPQKYLRHILVQSLSFWTLPETRTPSQVAAIRDYDLPEELHFQVSTAPLAVILLRRALYLVCLIAGGWLIFRTARMALQRKQIDAVLLGGTTAAVAAHGLLLMPILVHFAYPRYALPSWPAIVTCLILGYCEWRRSRSLDEAVSSSKSEIRG